MQQKLIEDLISIFGQGEDLLRSLPNNQIYVLVGGHFRHCLDFADCFFNGIETGKIDYNQRQREISVETDLQSALAKIAVTVEKLRNLTEQNLDGEIKLRHERAIDENDEKSWCQTTLTRELEFLQSHTVHHFAIIGLKLFQAGIKVDENFGVADSTLKYRKQIA